MEKRLTGINILVVEDDETLRELVCKFIEDSGATTFEAANGFLGFQIIEREKIDFVLSDVQMPVMDGIELLKKIRTKHPTFPPVLLMTGQCDISDENAITYGASGLLRKPFRVSEILTIIGAHIAPAQTG